MSDKRSPRDRPERSDELEAAGGPSEWEALGRAIKVERTARGWERRDLAERAGVSYPYLSEIETGKKRPSWSALGSIADALGLRASDLLQVAESAVAEARPQYSLRATSAAPAWLTGKPMMSRAVHFESRSQPRAELLRELLEYLERLPVEDLERLVALARALSAPEE